MKTCSDVEPLLPLYEWGAAAGPEREACDAHLPGCAKCLATFLALKRVREDAAAFDERPSPSTRDRLRARVARRGPRRRPVWVAVAAAAAIAFALAVRLLSSGPAAPRPAHPPALLIDSAPLSEDLL